MEAVFFVDFLGPLEETLCVFCFACCVLLVVLVYMVESLGYSLSRGCSAFTWGEAPLPHVGPVYMVERAFLHVNLV